MAAVAAAVEAARGDLGVPSEEGNGSEVGPSPSELDCGSTDLFSHPIHASGSVVLCQLVASTWRPLELSAPKHVNVQVIDRLCTQLPIVDHKSVSISQPLSLCCLLGHKEKVS